MSQTEEGIKQRRLLDNIEVIADRHAKIRPREFIENKFAGAKYWDMEAVLAAMKELHNSTVKNTLVAAADNAYIEYYGKITSGYVQASQVAKSSILDLEKDLLIDTTDTNQ